MTPQFARRLLAAALLLGVAGDQLLRTESWRFGFVLWIFGILGVALAATTRVGDQDPGAGRERRILFGSAALLALLLVLRDAPMLYALDVFALLVTGALLAWRAAGRPLAELEPRDAVGGGLAAATAIVGGAPTLAVRDSAPPELDAERRRTLGGLGIGLIAATPVLLIVAALLGQADPVFSAFLDTVGTWLETSAVEHVFGIILTGWVAAGIIRGAIAPVGTGFLQRPLALRLPFASVAPLFVGLALLLSSWIGLQVRTLFGGSEYVANTIGVTVAEYARQGFFELIVIAGIVLGSLLVADEVLDREPGKARDSFRAIGWVLLGLVGAVLVSAVLRLGLYLRHFGLTDDRVLALAVLVWVALMLVWFGWTVLRGARARFAPGVLIISAVWLGALNLSNPERWIVETNLRRAERGLEFDTAYHAKLSADALPALLRGADRLNAEQATALRTAIDAEWALRAADRSDWRRWSVPYLRAIRLTTATALASGAP